MVRKESMRHKTPKVLLVKLTRLLVSATLIPLLLWRIDTKELETALRGSRWWLFGLSTLILAARYLISGFRRQIILASQGSTVPVARLVYWYFVGGFFDMFLPTSLGGDAMRIYQAGKSMNRMARDAASVVLERMVGFAGMIAITCVALLFLQPALRQPEIYFGVLGFVVSFGVATVVILNRMTCRWTTWIPKRLHLSTIADRIEQAHGRLR